MDQHDPLPAEEKRKILVYSAYSKLLNTARHHGSLQTSYRMMASSWLLATFAAVGFLLSAEEVLPFSHLLGVALACVLGIIGLYVLWYEDTFVQELLLDMNVVEALELEKNNPWLPQLHHLFLHLYEISNFRTVKILYFMGCKTILIFIIMISLSFYLYPISIYLMIGAIVLCLAFQYGSSRFMLSKSERIQDFMKFLEDVDKKRR